MQRRPGAVGDFRSLWRCQGRSGALSVGLLDGRPAERALQQGATVGRRSPLHDPFASGVDALLDLLAVGLAPLYIRSAPALAAGVVFEPHERIDSDNGSAFTDSPVFQAETTIDGFPVKLCSQFIGERPAITCLERTDVGELLDERDLERVWREHISWVLGDQPSEQIVLPGETYQARSKIGQTWVEVYAAPGLSPAMVWVEFSGTRPFWPELDVWEGARDIQITM
jgi:hypothetical protein